jgi:hypothetical protein
MEEILGVSPERFPLTESAVVKQGNALTIPWDTVCPMDENTYIMGNPPFNGSRLMTSEQKTETQTLWHGTKGLGNLDYVTNWFFLGAKYANEKGARVGLVSTSSITQGEQPALLWKKLFQMGVGIDFAYRSFWWDNGAAVHCVIIGFSTQPKPKKRPLWKFSDIKGEPELTWTDNINPYLIDAPNILVSSRVRPLVKSAQPVLFGSQPNDAGFLSDISSDEAERIRREDPMAAKYLRRLIGARELLHNEDRWCLWLVDADPRDIRSSPELRNRVDNVKKHRLASARPATNSLSATPWLFGEIRQPTTDYIAVPLVSSEIRDYVPMALLSSEVIANNLISTILDGSLLTFGLLMSRPFNVWNKTVSGRLESRNRISGTITYNNFPFPETTEAQDEEINISAQAVLDSRNLFPNSSLADLYDPRSMPLELRKAHRQLDKAAMVAFGLKVSASDEEVLAELFRRYDDLTRGLLDATTFTKRKAKEKA